MSTPTRIPFRVVEVLDQVETELRKATSKFGSFASPHEGYAVILEEVDELWEAVKGDKLPNARRRMREEAVQVAAMGARFALDVQPYRGPAIASVDDAVDALRDGIDRASLLAHHGPFVSPHEGAAFIRLSLRPLGDAVADTRRDERANDTARLHALTTGGFAARFLLDIPEEN